jgi:hypothetical protein
MDSSEILSSPLKPGQETENVPCNAGTPVVGSNSGKRSASLAKALSVSTPSVTTEKAENDDCGDRAIKRSNSQTNKESNVNHLSHKQPGNKEKKKALVVDKGRLQPSTNGLLNTLQI